ncbi:uncharacterized protein LOC119077338 [Bradysia coprophila]|uniref:uncharacterized protein LOC119077338 n=1 Tax=Bradysia coprophila TaxID=38358 RepID=UPI00187D922B|nr:uncharacterized protein LOC119077338 [Bradysia coprophila]
MMDVEEPIDYTGSLYRFIAVYQRKEFIGQKAMNEDIEEEVGGDNCQQVLDVIWAKINPWIKREVVVDGDNFRFAEKETPDREEIAKFIIFHDKPGKKNYSVGQMTSDVIRKLRDKHVHVLVHVYGKAISSKGIHQKMTSAILQPVDRDRAGAHSTVMLTELAKQLKEIHGHYLSGNMSSWTMWANAIHSAPANRHQSMVNELPPAHLVHLFRSVPTSETERMRSTQHGLQVAGNLNDLYLENVKTLRQEFTKMKEDVNRMLDLYEIRLNATEDMLTANRSLVHSMGGQLDVEVTAVSLQEERQITDMEDCDHN